MKCFTVQALLSLSKKLIHLEQHHASQKETFLDCIKVDPTGRTPVCSSRHETCQLPFFWGTIKTDLNSSFLQGLLTTAMRKVIK